VPTRRATPCTCTHLSWAPHNQELNQDPHVTPSSQSHPPLAWPTPDTRTRLPGNFWVFSTDRCNLRRPASAQAKPHDVHTLADTPSTIHSRTAAAPRGAHGAPITPTPTLAPRCMRATREGGVHGCPSASHSGGRRHCTTDSLPQRTWPPPDPTTCPPHHHLPTASPRAARTAPRVRACAQHHAPQCTPHNGHAHEPPSPGTAPGWRGRRHCSPACSMDAGTSIVAPSPSSAITEGV